MTGRRIGVYICHCGGNISDYVDVAEVVRRVADTPEVVVARRAMFTCSDATQQEIMALPASVWVRSREWRPELGAG